MDCLFEAKTEEVANKMHERLIAFGHSLDPTIDWENGRAVSADTEENGPCGTLFRTIDGGWLYETCGGAYFGFSLHQNGATMTFNGRRNSFLGGNLSPLPGNMEDWWLIDMDSMTPARSPWDPVWQDNPDHTDHHMMRRACDAE